MPILLQVLSNLEMRNHFCVFKHTPDIFKFWDNNLDQNLADQKRLKKGQDYKKCRKKLDSLYFMSRKKKRFKESINLGMFISIPLSELYLNACCEIFYKAKWQLARNKMGTKKALQLFNWLFNNNVGREKI